MEVLVQDDIKRGVPSTSPKEVVISGVFEVKVEKVMLLINCWGSHLHPL